MSATREIVLKFDGETALQNMSNSGYISTSYNWCVMMKVYVDVESADGSVIWGGADDNGTPFTSLYIYIYNNKIRFRFRISPNGILDYNFNYPVSKSGSYNIAIRHNTNGDTEIICDGSLVDAVLYNPYNIVVRPGIGAEASYSGDSGFRDYSNQYIAEILQVGYAPDINQMPTSEEIIEMQNSDEKYSTASRFTEWNYRATYCDFTKQNLETIENGGLSTGELTVREGQTFYTLIPLEPKTGQLIAKKQKTYDITNKDYVIDYNYFFGGDFSIECDVAGEKTFTIGFWNEAQQGFSYAGKQTITGNIAQFSYGETATRRMKIGISSEQPLTELTLTQEKLFDVLVDSNGVSSGATTQDRFVNYNQVLNNSRTLTVRVKNEDYNFAQTLFKNKVYLDNEEWQISSLNVERLGLSHRKFNMSLQRLL